MRRARWMAGLVAAGLCACLQPVAPFQGAADSGGAADAGGAPDGAEAPGDGGADAGADAGADPESDGGPGSDAGAGLDAGLGSDAGVCEGLGCPCEDDSDCGAGAVCEPSQAPCDARAKRCVQGCHLQLHCPSGQSCALRLCLTCPCPGACTPEGLCQGNPTCAAPLDCSPGASTCTSGCCAACPKHPSPTCAEGECAYPGGLSPEGCPEPPICSPCPACAPLDAPVCSSSYATFANACEVEGIGQGVLHEDACLPGEGVACPAGKCPAGQYCRDSCRGCKGAISPTRCTMIGVCLSALDCPAGLPTPACATEGRWECVNTNHQCRFSCP